jgi:hypothetical protein
MTDHYATLGVPRTASLDQIRRAYRDRMRNVHPDSASRTSARGVSSAASTEEVTRIAVASSRPMSNPDLDRPYPPARFPWRFVLTIIGVGAAILIVLHILGDPMPERGIDGLISAGSCVDFDDVGAAYEVPCNGPHQAVARELVPFGSACDSDTTQARDRQGMGTVCIEP